MSFRLSVLECRGIVENELIRGIAGDASQHAGSGQVDQGGFELRRSQVSGHRFGCLLGHKTSAGDGRYLALTRMIWTLGRKPAAQVGKFAAAMAWTVDATVRMDRVQIDSIVASRRSKFFKGGSKVSDG